MKKFFIVVGIIAVLVLGLYVGANFGVSVGCSSGVYESARLETLDDYHSNSIENNHKLLESRCLNEEGSHSRRPK